MRQPRNALHFFHAFLLTVLLSACGGGDGGGDTALTYTVGGNVSGLTGAVVLQNNLGDSLTVAANGAFAFATPVAHGSPYAVSVLTQPAGQTCSVSTGTGTVSGNNVSNVAIICSANSYTVGGTIAGLSGTVVLQNNLGNSLTIALTIAANGAFTFATPVASGGAYSVTVLAHPTGQICSVSTGTGTVSGNNVSNVAIVCSANSYNVGGTIAGLSGTVVLQNNNGDNLTLSANGNFTFATAVAYGSPYVVSVFTQPTGQSCSLTNNTGTIAAAHVANVVIICAASSHTLGGTVTGLNGSMVLQNNGGNNHTVATNGTFTFATAVTYGTTYYVTLLSQQWPNQTCSVTGVSGTVTANVTNVAVNCLQHATPRFAYVANTNDSTVSIYTVDAATGQLRARGYVAAGAQPYSVTVDPSGKFAYVANNGSDNVSVYTIDASTGALTAVGAPVATGTSPYSVTVDPSGRFAYVANFGSNTVSVYTLNASTGALTVVGAAVAAGIGSVSVVTTGTIQ